MTNPSAPTVYQAASPNMLASRTSEAIGRNPDRRTGVVSAVGTDGSLTVTVSGGASERVGYLASYEPVVGDVVALVQQRSTWLCIGRLTLDGAPGGVPGTALGGVLFVTGATTTFNDGVEHLITGYQFTTFLPAGHLIQVRATFLVDNNTNDLDLPFMRIRETNISGTVVYGAYSMLINGHIASVQSAETWFRPAADATKTYVLTGQRVFGAATYNIARFGTFAAFDYGRSPNVVTL